LGTISRFGAIPCGIQDGNSVAVENEVDVTVTTSGVKVTVIESTSVASGGVIVRVVETDVTVVAGVVVVKAVAV